MMHNLPNLFLLGYLVNNKKLKESVLVSAVHLICLSLGKEFYIQDWGESSPF